MSNQSGTTEIPPKAYAICFPSLNFDSNFDSSSYSPDLTDGRASTQEITQVLSRIESIMKPCDKKTRRANYILLFYSILCLLPAFYLWITSGGNSIVYTVAIIAVFIGYFIWSLYTNKVIAIMRSKCKETVERHNQDFNSRGLRWHLPESFPLWIELWKDYNQPQDQPIDVPQFAENPFQQGKSGYIPPSEIIEM